MKAMLHGKPRNYRMVSISTILQSPESDGQTPDRLFQTFRPDLVKSDIKSWPELQTIFLAILETQGLFMQVFFKPDE